MGSRMDLAEFSVKKEYFELERKRMGKHLTRNICKDSRWPYTDFLTPKEIVCMRDTYPGKRILHSYVQPRSNYDRIFHFDPGYDQRNHKEDMSHLRTIQYSARDEEKYRKIPTEANHIYGQYHSRFYDTTNKMNPHLNVCERQFLTRNSITNLPPLPNPGWNRRSCHPNYIQS